MPRFCFKKRIKKKNIVLITIILLIIIIVLILKYVSKNINPILMEYAKEEATRLSSIILNYSTKKNIENFNTDNLFIITKENESIKTIDFNSKEVNKLLTNITYDVQNYFKKIDEGDISTLELNYFNYSNKNNLKKGIIYEIPIGVLSGNSVISNIGPKIPVRINLYGEVLSKIDTKITNYGINNALIEVLVNINIKTRVILPFTSEIDNISISIPIAIKLIEGSVPNYYGISDGSKYYSIPLE